MWTLVESSVQGRGHLSDGSPCQDKTFKLSRDGVSTIALADGAGSAKLSQFGAECAVRCVSELLAASFEAFFSEEDGLVVKQSILQTVRLELLKLTGSLGCSDRDLASTLLAVAVKGSRYIIVHIGDGVIGYMRHGEVKVASYPENGEFVNTTIFTTSQEALSTMTLLKGELNGINGFVLMSDGTETSLYHKQTKTLAPVLARILELAGITPTDIIERRLTDSLASVIRMNTTDDCSIAMMTNGGDNFPGFLGLPREKQCSFLGIDYNDEKECCFCNLERYQALLVYLQAKHSPYQASQFYCFPISSMKKHFDHLLECNLIEKTKGKFHRTTIILKTSEDNVPLSVSLKGPYRSRFSRRKCHSPEQENSV